MSPLVRRTLRPGTLTLELAALIRSARTSIGWSQDQLADRACTSQSKVWRMEHDRRGAIDLETLDRVLTELGLGVTLEIEGRHLSARAEQRDIVHATLLGIFAGRLRRAGWLVATEVATGHRAPTGWIDLLAFRERDSALIVGEIKTVILDVGGVQRQVAFYEREAAWAARRQGWQPAFVAVLLACLDSAEIGAILEANRRLLVPAFPGDPIALESWLRSPDMPRPIGPTVAAIDLAERRRRPDLRRTPLTGRRSAPSFAGYADAARLIDRRRP